MRFDVKITTLNWLLDLFCPYTCQVCGCLGTIMCERCKNYMLEDCRKREVFDCTIDPLGDLFVGGNRGDVLGMLISRYKYDSVRILCNVLVEVLVGKIGLTAHDVVVVPLPTIAKHVRQRGFDHTLLLAQHLAVAKRWRCDQILNRRTNTVQVGTKARERMIQASKTYTLNKPVKSDVYYLLLDDVWTTGASMRSAAKILSEAGATMVGGAVVAMSKPVD